MSWITSNINKDVADYLFNIRINSLPERIGIFQRDVRPDFIIDFDNLEEQLQETPEMIAFWDQLLAEQKSKVAKIERKIIVTRGFVIRRMLQDAREQGTSIRSADLKDIVNADTDMVLLNKDLIKEELVEDKVKSVVRCLQTKSEHLRSLAGFKRQERQQTGG